MREKYLDSGYIRAQISEPIVDVSDDGIEVTLEIDEGPQFHVGTVDVIGDESIELSSLQRSIVLSPGDVFSRSTLTDDVERVRFRYTDRGFYAAEVHPRTNVDPDALTVDLVFEVEKGELFFVDWIEVAGNTRTRDDVVRRELNMDEGGLYSYGALERSKARVRRLGYFEEVNVEAEETPEGNLGLVVDVVERPTGSFSFGAGFGSVDGLLLTASIRQDNLMGRGYSLGASIDVGSSRRFGTLRFSNRALFGSPAAFAVAATLNEWEFSDFDQSMRGFTFDLSYPLDEGETRAGIGYGFSSREVDDFDLDDSASLIQREELQDKTTTSLINLSLRQDTRDDIRFPRAGHTATFGIDFAGLGGISKFVRFDAHTTKYWPMADRLGFDSTFVANTRLGYTVPFNSIGDFDLPSCPGTPDIGSACQLALVDPDLEEITRIDDDLELALSERYFLGGVGRYQLRGFEQRSVGPRRSTLIPVEESLITTEGGTRVFCSTINGLSDQGSNFVYLTGGSTQEVFVVQQPDQSCNFVGTGPRNLGPNDFNETDADDFADLDRTDVIGGNSMFLLNLELRFPLSEELGLEGSVFFDMGNAFAENDNINPADFRFGTGVATTWFSPFGPILLTFGIPLDPLDDEDSSVFEFSLGGQQF